ncbi:kinase-like domain-containing protein, partial [Chytridium lagenaria]
PLTTPQKTTPEYRQHFGSERTLLRHRRTRLRLSAFDIQTQIGQGGYGQVFLARKKDTNEICALKKMSKRLLVCMGEVDHILTERDILTWSNSEWLIKLLYAFQDVENVYLAMEYAAGGDLRTLLNNSGVLREEHARFYISEMMVAVGNLHELGYIHR